VTISDQSQEDLPAYQGVSQALKTVNIEVNALSPFDRERSQRWWDSNGRKDRLDATQSKVAADTMAQ